MRYFYHILLFGFFSIPFFFTPKNVFAQSVSGISVLSQTVKVYEKYEARFSIQTQSQYPFFQYDTNPPAGVTPGLGITVEGIFTSPSGKQYRQPAFYMTEVVNNNDVFTETNKKYWAIRFSPQEVGQYQVSVAVQDASGSTTTPIGSFQATTASKDGFIKVSKSDTRYFEFSNGKQYWPIGPATGTNYTQYKDTGFNLERPWMGGRGAYSTNWARWKSSAENHGNEGIMTRLNWREKFPGHDLSYELSSTTTPSGFEMFLGTWMDEQFGPRLQAGKKYQVKLTYKLTNLAGPSSRCGSCSWGLTIKTFNQHHWGITDVGAIENFLRNAPTIVSYQTANKDWNTVATTFTAPYDSQQIYVYLDNVSNGQAYIDEFSMKEVLADGSLGGEVIRNPKADMHTYVEQRPAAFFDWQIEQGEKNGVFFKWVVHDKNDWIQNHLKTTGEFADSGNGYYQAENTKARWLLRQWYRYIVARWGYSTALHSLELNNEGPPNEESNGTAAHWNTAQAFAKYVHDIYPSRRILATTSFWCCWRPRFWGNNTSFPDIDYADLHEYTDNREGSSVPDSTYDMAMWNYNSSMYAYNNGYPSGQKGVGKPLMRAETGVTENALKSANPGIWFHNLLWAQLNPGAMFDVGYWWSEHFNVINETAISKPFYLFIKDTDFNKGGFSDIAATSSNTKLRVFGQKNTSTQKAYFWIQNSDHTWKKVMDGVTTSQSGNVNFSMSPNTTYTVETWNTYTGVKSTPTNLTSNSSGVISIPITSLTDDVGIKIFGPGGQTQSTPTPAPVSCLGDITGDNVVNLSDYLILVQNFLRSPLTNIKADLNGDGAVNLSDYSTLVRTFLRPCT